LLVGPERDPDFHRHQQGHPRQHGGNLISGFQRELPCGCGSFPVPGDRSAVGIFDSKSLGRHAWLTEDSPVAIDGGDCKRFSGFVQSIPPEGRRLWGLTLAKVRGCRGASQSQVGSGVGIFERRLQTRLLANGQDDRLNRISRLDPATAGSAL